MKNMGLNADTNSPVFVESNFLINNLMKNYLECTILIKII